MAMVSNSSTFCRRLMVDLYWNCFWNIVQRLFFKNSITINTCLFFVWLQATVKIKGFLLVVCYLNWGCGHLPGTSPNLYLNYQSIHVQLCFVPHTNNSPSTSRLGLCISLSKFTSNAARPGVCGYCTTLPAWAIIKIRNINNPVDTWKIELYGMAQNCMPYNVIPYYTYRRQTAGKIYNVE